MNYQYEYPRPAVAVDIVVIRQNESQPREVLLIKRLREPFADQWAVPGGFLDENETLEQAAARELMEETGLECQTLCQLQAFSTLDRDPRSRVISVAFLANILPDQTPIAADDAKDVGWFPIGKIPRLAFDHKEMIALALKKLRAPQIT